MFLREYYATEHMFMHFALTISFNHSEIQQIPSLFLLVQ